MRRCTIMIKNSGTGDVEFVEGQLEHGEWVPGWSPPRMIKPGEERGFRSDRSDGIPIFGTWRGNEGWVLYKTLADGEWGGPQEVFVKFLWDLPYWGKPIVPYFVTSYDDLRKSRPGATEFDVSDKSPTNLHIKQAGGIVSAGDRVIDLLQAPPVPLTLLGDNVKVSMDFDILDSRPPGSTKLPPFSAGPKPQAIPGPVVNTNASMWVGRWAGERMSASIVGKESNRLAVTISERNGQESTAGEAQIVGINRIVTKYVHADAVKYEAGGPDQLDRALPILGQEEIGKQLGRATKLNPESAAFPRIVEPNHELLSGAHKNPVRLGGDYLNVDPDAVLEMHRLVADGETVDVALRYRRPVRHLAMIGATAVDELLTYVPDVR